MASDPSHPSVSRIVRDDGLRGRVVDHLIEAIFSGGLRAGDRLIVQRLAEQLGISATPVREALVELDALGLVDILPSRGAVCRPFGPRELRELYQIRRLLEVEATRVACGSIPREDLLDLKAAFKRLRSESPEDERSNWSARAQQADLRLHQMIAAHCNSDRLKHEIEKYDDLMRSLRQIAGNERNVQLQAVGEHLGILDALLAGDAELAAKRVGDHIAKTAVGVERVMFGGRADTKPSERPKTGGARR